jgi:hypothetical protein
MVAPPQTSRDIFEIPAMSDDLDVDDVLRGRKTHLFRR